MVGTSTELQSARLWHLYLDLCICNACKRYNACLTIIVSVFQVGQPWLRILPKPLLILRQSLSSYYSTTLNSNDFIVSFLYSQHYTITHTVQIENLFIHSQFVINNSKTIVQFSNLVERKLQLTPPALIMQRNAIAIYSTQRKRKRERGEKRGTNTRSLMISDKDLF